MNSPGKIASLLLFSLCLCWSALTAHAEVASIYARSHNVSRTAANAIASGSGHSCMRFEDGTLRCWGQNEAGQLGDGTTTNRPSPVPVERFANINLTGVVTVVAGLDHTCALKATGRVVCWGDNSQGQLGLGDPTITRRLRASNEVDLDNVIAIAAGGLHTCAIRADSFVFCWGNNDAGQVGDNSLTTRFAPTQVIQPGNFALTSMKSIVAGFAHTCALGERGSVRCWGDNSRGQLGTNDTTNRRVATNVSGTRNSRVTALAAGHSHTCALRTRGELVCWGNNDDGQLGDNSRDQRLVPTVVAGTNTDVVGISAGLVHTCAVASTGRIRCWGFNGFQQLGDGTTDDRLIPTDVMPDPFQRNFIGVASGEIHTCGLTVFHIVVCWGDNSLGQLGQGTFTGPGNPVTVPIGSNIGAIAIGAGGQHTCALRVTGRISCWGRNTDGQLGLGTVNGPDQTQPVLIPPNGIPQALDLSLGSNHTCAVLIPGRVRCWGRNTDGQIGDGTLSSARPSPIEVPNLTNIVSVAAGDTHTCALTADGQVFCWGAAVSQRRVLGIGAAPNPIGTVQVPGIFDAIQIIADQDSTCAVLSDVRVQCWGEFLGDGEVSSFLTSPTVMLDAILAAVGNGYVCGLLSNGTILCIGRDTTGQLGDGDGFVSHSGANAVMGIDDSTLIAGGPAHACALHANGHASCWGSDNGGRVGDGPPTPTQTPGVVSPREVVRDSTATPLPALTLLLAIALGGGHTCAVQSSGAPFCWGVNGDGQLGLGTEGDNRDAAVEVPSFRFNLAPNGVLQQNGKRADLVVQANCQEEALAQIDLIVRQGAITAEGHATVQCTGQLELYPVTVRADDKGPLVPGPSEAEAVITVEAHGQVVDVLRWNRTVQLGN
jgi:alpha-tubulin suppressor-like RCC1 family protein